MNLHARGTAVLAGVVPLIAGALALVPGVVTGAAGAACAPSTVVAARQARASGHVKVARSTPTVTRRHGHAYVARIRLSATQGSATVRLVVGICPDGSAGAVTSTTQTASGRGVTHRTATGKGRSAAAARRVAERAAAAASTSLRRASVSTKTRHRAEKRAVAAARAAAAAKATEALTLSDVVYAAIGADGVYHLIAVPPAGQVTLTRSATDDLVLTVPAGFVPKSATSRACVRRAPAWPTSFVFDGGDLAAPVLQASAAGTTVASYGIDAAPWQDPTGTAKGQEPVADQLWFGGWQSGSGSAAYDASVAPDTPAAAPLVCFEPTYPVTSGGYTATLHGAHVGAAAVTTGGDLKVPGGVPVMLR